MLSFWKCFSCIKFSSDEDIVKLDYSSSSLNDVPPDISQFERTLEELYLSSNRISDLPPELFYCQSLRILKLNDNELQIIPTAIGSFRQLHTLDLSRNALSFLPDEIKSCKYLTYMDLSLNNLQRLPDAITNCISLQELLLNETFLEFLPANFGRLINLRILELRSNNLVTLPKSMSRLVNLTRLDIGANEFTELPEVVGNLINLRELWIDFNRIRRISANISNLKELIHFEANNNQIKCLPNGIGNWHNLEVLSLSINDIDEIPYSIGMLKNLQTFKCDTNQLREIPDSICHCEKLQEIIISHNTIMRLPNTIGLLRKLEFLAADENCIRRLPNELCSCTSLTVLTLRGNKIEELPQDIGYLINLRVINVVNNLLTTIPASVLNLTGLSALWISDNQSQPLVPFQYIDNITKNHLTCFMLPQLSKKQAKLMKQQQHESNLLQNSEQNTNLEQFQSTLGNQQQQQQQKYYQNYLNKASATTTSSRINSNENNIRRICFADEHIQQTVNEALPPRLMRSPTPYPKELRLMSKYAKNINNKCPTINEMITPNNYDETMDEYTGNGYLRVKEARILNNSGNISNSSIFYTSDDKSEPYGGCQQAQQQQQLQNYHRLHNNQHSQIYNQSKQQDHSHIQSSGRIYDQSPVTNYILDTSSVLDQVDGIPESQLQWRDSIYDIPDNKSISIASGITGSGEVVSMLRQPPPYHVAKAFTKKSREDLLNYDSLRNQTDQYNHTFVYRAQNNQNDCNSTNDCDSRNGEINDGQFNIIIKETDYLNDNTHNIAPLIDKIDIINSNISDNSITSDSQLFRQNSEAISGGNMENNDNCRDHSQLSSSTLSLHKQNTSKILPSSHDAGDGSNIVKGGNVTNTTKNLSSSQWLFGLHKNPTVKQVTVRKEPHLGFNVRDSNHEDGIFVSATVPNTSASQQLQPGDKILDLDGMDFGKLSLTEAQNILHYHSGPIVTIMLSRK